MKESDKSFSANNTILTKSFKVSVRTVKAYKILIKRDSSLMPLFKQLLRSGTSIGANISEAQSAFTKKDFINKLGISLKESRETEYWLRLLRECDLFKRKRI